ncbi:MULTISPECIES: ATP-dependent helicase [unclassified Streptomyces]|uniref:UvrD-helicase domain-containing protein n=1 Tax=unclassified Streptomyces TaxID=2593676 RepID=UPI0018D6AD9E|nr:ATP-dependent helicase [Streptomyces sp. HB-N217]MBH5129510.1 ATP-dependent helicase [Streptomyces sp. HB-N217]
MELDGLRRAILASTGHVLIEGGPGCGKTTIALLKALDTLDSLEAGQRVLFLSFSRAAVRQITDRMGGLFGPSARTRLEVRTFHAFFLELVRSHGRLLTGRPASFITPDRERELRADFDGDKDAWLAECRRTATEESRYVFDLLAPTAATLLEGSTAVRALYSSVYPLVIVDEFQDTNIDQWRAVKALSKASTVICLADPDQRIFGHLPGVDEERITHAIDELQPVCYDLSKDNYRSPEGGLLGYANAVLHDTPFPVPDSVKTLTYSQQWWTPGAEVRAHEAVIALREHLRAELGRDPTLAVLAPTNHLVARISETISVENVTAHGVLPPVEHDLHWDPELAAAAGFVVASILEWPALPRPEALTKTLRAVADFYRTKLIARNTAGARTKIQTIERALTAMTEGKTVRSKTALALMAAFDAGLTLSGRPVTDWQKARALLQGSAELDELFKQVRMLRLLNATDSLALALTQAWDGAASYTDAATAVRRALASDQLAVPDRPTAAVSLMNMHRSKGKEFDGVVIAEGAHHSRLLDITWDEERIRANRRLLRVAITRARHMVVFVRPEDAVPLIPHADEPATISDGA